MGMGMQAEESIPLTSASGMRGEADDDDDVRQRKGKERLRDGENGSGNGHGGVEAPIFDVGDSDEEDFKHTRK